MHGKKIQLLQQLLPACFRQDRHRLGARLQDFLQRRLSGQAAGAALDRLIAQARRSAEARQRRKEQLPSVTYPEELPISAQREEIIAAIRAHPVVIVAGETGSGKTTQLPKMCVAAGLGLEGRIGCTQPRRVAALSISRRLAKELGVSWGREVGCKIRFSDQSSPETRIKVMTDGILLAETQGDPTLDEYEALIIDEAHERSLNIDFLLGYLKTLRPRRPDLKLIITSATIDTEAFAEAFDHAPVLEVSGRLFPVTVRYAPHDPEAEERGDLTYVDAAVAAVETIQLESKSGDILVFMPGERDIRETTDRLEKSQGRLAEVLPLFGRLSAANQERVFGPSAKRKIIVATNIAETSLTIPGIRYVIDPGLARLSRYNPRTRTKRLPIEPISQSSARQRAGRSGRVAEGTCIRLYAEEEFLARPRFTQPEIQRANLAEVILRMKAFRLGDIEAFPFLNPPTPQAIRSGYQLLQELGALDRERRLTRLGRDLARLPVDPSIGRMVLQSVQEQAAEEVLVIAAGLSIQDPRERPADRQAAADLAHRQFLDPRSDFITLLNIWNAFHDTWESLRTQNQLRKFCRANFLSYLRMREWGDIHAQLRESLREVMGSFAPSRHARPYAGIHRSILAGLLGHVARRSGRNLYRGAGQREMMVFPASTLFDRREPRKRGPGRSTEGPQAPPNTPTAQPEWIVAGEILETSRVYARTVARIDPVWIAKVGRHLCQSRYADPHWDRATGRVVAREHITLFGLPVQEKWTDYGRIQPQEATRIFIQSALVEETLEPIPPFLEHNRRVRQRVEAWRTQARSSPLPDPDRAMFDFYARHLHNVWTVDALTRLLRRQLEKDPDFLQVKECDLTGGEPLRWNANAFPSEVRLAGQIVYLDYAYAPGEEADGVTVRLPVALAHRIQPHMLDWIVPGLREDQIAFLIKRLPKALRVSLMPTTPKVQALAAALQPEDGLDALRHLIRQKYGVSIPARAWSREVLPDYLRVRIAIMGRASEALACGRDLKALQASLEQHETPAEQKAWNRTAAAWERYDLQGWTFPDPPPQIEVATEANSSSSLQAFPGLAWDGEAVHLKLYRRPDEAERASQEGWRRLGEAALRKELAWLQKDLKALKQVGALYLTLGPVEELLAAAYANVCRHLLRPPLPVLPLRKETFERGLRTARTSLADLVPRLSGWIRSTLELRQELLLCKKPYAAMQAELAALVPRRFLDVIPFDRLEQVPRYLRAMQVRAERAALSAAKDQEKARRVQPYAAAGQRWCARGLATAEGRRLFETFRWMVEEFKVSVFAQELGTAEPVSAKRLDAVLEALEQAEGHPLLG